jgi:acetoin utilization deacetylase AcuC-like enzyme
MHESSSTSARRKSVKLEPIHMLYDERMLLHRPIGWVEPAVFPEDIDECDDDYPMENPERLRVVYDRLSDVEERLEELIDQGEQERQPEESPPRLFRPLQCEMATKEQICRAHSEEQYNRLHELQDYSDETLEAFSSERRHDIYYSVERPFKPLAWRQAVFWYASTLPVTPPITTLPTKP